jgi:hypothetical protein
LANCSQSTLAIANVPNFQILESLEYHIQFGGTHSLQACVCRFIQKSEIALFLPISLVVLAALAFNQPMSDVHVLASSASPLWGKAVNSQ